MYLLSFSRNTLIKTTLVLIVSVQVLNISIDPIDHLTGSHDVAVNEIESCIEFVLEVMMDKQEAIKEVDEADEAPEKQASTIAFFCIGEKRLLSEIIFKFVAVKNYSATPSQFTSLTIPVVSPPPKAI